MALKLYNTLTRQKAAFTPIDPKNVRMYVCGPTVYDFAHIGNARPVIVFDVLFRLLRHLAKQGVWDGGRGETKVTYVRNITDVDDKINARAAQEHPDLPLNEAIRKVTEATERQFHADIAALGVLPPTFEPRATEYIRRGDGREDMVSLIEALVKRGHAYVAEDHVLFDVASMPDYGRLSNRSLDEMEAGARVEVAPYKKGPMDFVLWKPSKPGEPAWPSPCGIATPGRPGWHIECSAMAGALLGKEFDIHGGGIDLTFPHHENEIAQSRCAHGTPVMANVWMHNGFLQVEGEKMSKSLGNFVTIHELLETEKFGGRKWPGDIIRIAMLMTHYRQPIDWTIDRLREAQVIVQRVHEITSALPIDMSIGEPSQELIDVLSDDLNTPAAISIMQEACRKNSHSEAEAGQLLSNMVAIGAAPSREKSLEILVEIKTAVERLKKQSVSLTDVFRRMYGLGPIGRSRPTLLHYLRAHSEVEPIARFVKYAAPGMTWRSFDEHLEQLDVLEVNRKIEGRLEARKRKDFAESDRIRDELAKMGIALKDTKNKETGEIETTWEVAR